MDKKEVSDLVGKEINSSGKQFFDNVVFDNIIESLVELTAAVWTYKDRSMVLEKVLQSVIKDKEDLDLLIENYEPTPEDIDKRKKEREALVANVFKSFSRRPNNLNDEMKTNE
ncbi:MAG: hypothetical protein CBC47_08845 [Alphaproteobacteria bacterium TMED87]|nr:hypothetical protein [Rhodospirillaceae bacterium]OUV07649.1 MAG: hypothetical protein CBC47_08845 [Alphaproteobacteria bacterium TMED87]